MDSVKQNRIVPMPIPNTLADALERVLGADPPDSLSARDGVLCGCRGEILLAMQFAYERLKLVIERSSAVALVPLLRQEHQLVSNRVGVMLTGGNVEWLRSWPRLDRIETMQQSAIGWSSSHACEGL
jgi:threonine dehydratase